MYVFKWKKNLLVEDQATCLGQIWLIYNTDKYCVLHLIPSRHHDILHAVILNIWEWWSPLLLISEFFSQPCYTSSWKVTIIGNEWVSMLHSSIRWENTHSLLSLSHSIPPCRRWVFLVMTSLLSPPWSCTCSQTRKHVLKCFYVGEESESVQFDFSPSERNCGNEGVKLCSSVVSAAFQFLSYLKLLFMKMASLMVCWSLIMEPVWPVCKCQGHFHVYYGGSQRMNLENLRRIHNESGNKSVQLHHHSQKEKYGNIKLKFK